MKKAEDHSRQEAVERALTPICINNPDLVGIVVCCIWANEDQASVLTSVRSRAITDDGNEDDLTMLTLSHEGIAQHIAKKSARVARRSS